jgi:hypothetical protein
MEGTIPAEVSNRKAREEREMLFSALEALANLTESPDGWKKFLRQSPDFLPEVAYTGLPYWNSKGSPSTEKPGFFWIRDSLRKVWRGADTLGVYLNALLGVDHDVVAIDRAWDASIQGHGGLGLSRARANWQTGDITFDFRHQFQAALFALMRESWRAKVCPECSRYFIASKTAQSYCSSVCYGSMKRKRSLDYWRRTGRANRARAVAKAKKTSRSIKKRT